METNNIIKYRREFHKYPEIGWREYRTTARIAEILQEIGFENIKVGKDAVDIYSIVDAVKLTEDECKYEMKRAVEQGANVNWVLKTEGYTGVVAEFNSGKKGPVIGFRFDIDALPYEEPKEIGFKPFDEGYISDNSKKVHACAHDGHTAIGLGLAEEIIKNKSNIKGKIKLFFQPAEETFSGAESIVAKGHLDDVDYFVGMHIAVSSNNLPLLSKSIACGCNDFLSVRQIDVYYEGKSAHPCGASHEGKNALLAACTAALNLHSIAPHEEGLFRVNVGEIHAGVVANTIAPNALMKVEYRGENENISKYAKSRVETIIDSAAKMYDLKYHIKDYGEVPTAKSDVEMMNKVREAAKKISYYEYICDYGNVSGSDDASVMMRKVQSNGGKSVYIGLGANVTEPVHNARFDFDEEILSPAVELCLNIIKDI